jgi:phosphoribosylformimino-5-aminoimidazole carboxamide ribotide isomerase
MEIIPAIDIRNGKCVRLYQGDYSLETVFGDDPIALATSWVEQGATRLHVVDLDGAKSGEPVNLGIAAKIARSVNVPVQLGGGIRSLAIANNALSHGLACVILGTAAVSNPTVVDELVAKLGPESFMVSVDAKNGRVMTDGWTKDGGITALELVKRIAESGARKFVYTDVMRDGTLTEPNFDGIRDITSNTDLGLFVAGGISSVSHLKQLADLGVEAAIVGSAVYTRNIDLQEAILLLEGHQITTE